MTNESKPICERKAGCRAECPNGSMLHPTLDTDKIPMPPQTYVGRTLSSFRGN